MEMAPHHEGIKEEFLTLLTLALGHLAPQRLPTVPTALEDVCM